ncbi:Rab sub of small GTPases [Coemansia biformis]|uniref:Rab sub of small GTPases n=1 Tax=Coemansia biformis TaxID=1286918 RepID=A0A9W8CWL8_9FUNG|nr:Rab sub of small GTPases [Coemansia biformis]
MERILKVVMVGAAESGKTSLRNYFLHGNYAWQYTPTANPDFVSTHVTLPSGELTAVQIWDTSGGAADLLATHSLAEDADGVVLVYDGTSAASLRALERLLPPASPAAQRLRRDAVPVVVVQTKADLPPSVRPAQADDLCRALLGARGAAWMQASARTGDGVVAVFQAVADACTQRLRGVHEPAPGELSPKPRQSRHGDPIPYHLFEIEGGSATKARRRWTRSPPGRLRHALRRLLCFA